MYMYKSCFVVLVVALLLGQTQSRRDPCNEKECPEYTTICSSSEYEAREYKESWWISTTITSFSRGYAAYEGAGRIYRYLNGENADNAQIRAGWPVLTQLRANVKQLKEMVADGVVSQRRFSIAVFLPKEYWNDNAPTPTDPSVTVENLPRMNFFVKNFGGWSTGVSTFRSARYLMQKLLNNEEAIDTDWVYLAKYQRPNQVFSRRNEIWFFYPRFHVPACARTPPVDNNLPAPEVKPYQVLEIYDNGIEKRKFPGGEFVAYTVPPETCKLRDALIDAFGALKRLVLEIRRSNPEFRPEGPLIMRIAKKQNPTEEECDKEFCLLHPVDNEHKALLQKMPDKLKQRMEVRTVEGFETYAYMFPGYLRQQARRFQGKFREGLDRLGVCYDSDEFFLALNSKPSKLFDRKNTILFPAKECERRWWKK